MAQLVADCPRCGAQRMTFEIEADNFLASYYGWQNWFEVFAVCGDCANATIFVVKGRTHGDETVYKQRPSAVSDGTINRGFEVDSFISLKHIANVAPPDFVDEPIAEVFREGATCMAVECWNAAGTMFRLCLDLVTAPLLPPPETPNGPNAKQRRDLGLRIPWLIQAGLIPADLAELSQCVREDGNDGAHAGTLEKEDAEDILDFTTALLERLVTEPKRIKRAEERRRARRGEKN